MRKIILCIIVVLLLLQTGCESNDDHFAKLDIDIIVDEDCYGRILSSNEKAVLISIGEYNRNNIGATTNTKALISTKLNNKTVEKIACLSGCYQVPSAISYQDGFIYVSYNEKDSRYYWSIIKKTNLKTETIMEGSINDYFDLPKLDYLGNKVMILWKDDIKNISALSLLDDKEEVYNIVEKKSNWVINIDKSNNTQMTCFYIVENEIPQLVVADTTGIVEKVLLDGKMISFSITKSNVVCVLSDYEDKGIYHLMNYSMKTKEYNSILLSKPLYNLSGSDGNLIIANDDSFQLYCINVNNNSINPVNYPAGTSFTPVNYDKVIGGEVIVHFASDTIDDYYSFDLNSFN